MIAAEQIANFKQLAAHQLQPLLRRRAGGKVVTFQASPKLKDQIQGIPGEGAAS